MPKKKYCFELPFDSEKEHTVLKIKYKAEYGAIPPNLTHIYSSNENYINNNTKYSK